MHPLEGQLRGRNSDQHARETPLRTSAKLTREDVSLIVKENLACIEEAPADFCDWNALICRNGSSTVKPITFQV